MITALKRSLVSVTLLLGALHAHGETATLVATTGCNEKERNRYISLGQELVAAKDFQTKCKKEPKSAPQKFAESKGTISCDSISNYIASTEKTQRDLSTVCNFGGGSNSANQCQTAISNYDTKVSEARRAVSKLGLQCSSDSIETCQEYSESGDADFVNGASLSEFLEACPFFAAREAKKYKEEAEALEKEADAIAEEIEKIEARMKEEKAENEKRESELKQQILDAQSEAKAALDSLASTVQDLRSGSLKNQSAILSGIRALQAKMTSLTTEEFGKVRNDYTRQVLDVEQRCYESGFAAARAEAERLKSKGGIASDDLGRQMAAGGAVAYLRSIANAAFQQCLQQGGLSRISQAADDTYQERVRLLESQYGQMNAEIQGLQQQHQQIARDLPQQVQIAQQQAFADAQAKASRASQLEQEYSQLASQLQVGRMRAQQQLSQLATNKFRKDSELRKAKSAERTASSKGSRSDVSEEDFANAVASCGAIEDQQRSVIAACDCKGSSPDKMCSTNSAFSSSTTTTRGQSPTRPE